MMKKKQFAIAFLPAVLTLLILLFNVLAERQISSLYRQAVAAVDAQEYGVANSCLNTIGTIAPEYVPQYELWARLYLEEGLTNKAKQQLEIGIDRTGSKRLISMREELREGTLTFASTTSQSSTLPQNRPTDWYSVSAGFSSPNSYGNTGAVEYRNMNYDLIVRYPDSMMGEQVQLKVDEDSDSDWQWSSDNPAVATVDDNGLVTCGDTLGQAKITAIGENNSQAICWVCVMDPNIYSQDTETAGQEMTYSQGNGSDTNVYYYIQEGNLQLKQTETVEKALQNTRTGSVLELLPHTEVQGEGLVGTAEMVYSPSGEGKPTQMVDQNGFPIYEKVESTPIATAEQAVGQQDGGTIQLTVSQSLYLSGEYRIPEQLQFGGRVYTTTSVNFYNAYDDGVTSLYLPAVVTDLGNLDVNPLTGYHALAEITVEEGNPAFHVENGALLTADGTTLIAYPPMAEATEYVIPDGVTRIASNAFQNAQNLKTIRIPSSVTEIGSGAFTGLQALEDIQLDAGNTAFQLKDGVLYDAQSTQILAAAKSRMPENFTIPQTVQDVESTVFSDNDRIKQLTVDGALPSFSLNNCTALEEVTINGSLYSFSVGGVNAVQHLVVNGEVQDLTLAQSQEDYAGSVQIELNTPVQSLSVSGMTAEILHPENAQKVNLSVQNGKLPTLPQGVSDLRLDLRGDTFAELPELQANTAEKLELFNGNIGDLSVLTTMPNLKQLSLRYVACPDLDPVWQCTNLTSLEITGNEDLASIDKISALEQLTDLTIDSAPIQDISALASCTKLKTVTLSFCTELKDVSVLTGLPELENVNLQGTSASETDIQALQALGIIVY